MVDASEIREHMEVLGPNGEHIGTVDRVEDKRIKLTKSDSGDGQHHYVPLEKVEGVKAGAVRLSSVDVLH